MSQFKAHLEHCDPETLVMLRAIEDMAKASAQVFTGRESEERIQQRIKGCQAHIVNEEVQAAYEKEVLKPLHALFFFHETRAIFNSHGRDAKSEKVHEVRVEASAGAANTSIPDIVVTAPPSDNQEDVEELETKETKQDVATDFTDPTKSLTTIPKKGSQDRQKLWTNMEVNVGALQKVDLHGKDGLFYKSQPGLSKLPFEVSLKESSIRPVVTMEFKDEQDIKEARALINSEISSQYLTQPPMPVLVAVKFPKASILEQFKDIQHASVNVELAPATIGQIGKAAILLHATQKKYWEADVKSWKWELLRIPKKGLKGEVKEAMGLMKSNPVFIRIPNSTEKVNISSVSARTQQSTTASGTNSHTDTSSQEQKSGKKLKEENDSGKEEIKTPTTDRLVEGGQYTSVEQGRGGGIGSFVGGFVRKVLG